MAAEGITTVYPKPGVTLYLPGGVHGFTAARRIGVQLADAHAAPLVAAGHLETDASRAKAQAAHAPAEPAALPDGHA